MEFLSPKALAPFQERLLFQPELVYVLDKLLTMNRNKHLLIKGPVGCGQGIASREIANHTTTRNIIKISPSNFLFPSAGESVRALDGYLTQATGGLLYICDLDELFTSTFAFNILSYLNIAIEREGVTLLFTGEVGIDKINALNPDLYTKFLLAKVKNFTPDELVTIFFQELEIRDIKHKIKPKEVLNIISHLRTTGNLKNARLTRLLAEKAVLDKKLQEYTYLSKLSLEQSAKPYLRSLGESGFRDLDDLIGLSDIKRMVKLWMKNLALDDRRKILGINVEGMGQHMVFKGPAGTAKTTVARIISKILAETGIITSGHLVETSKTDLVGDSSEETTRKVTQMVRNALGGVLFIDEAYSLSSEPETRDQGKEAIDTLLKLMEDYRDDLVVIVAGYPLEMEQFLSSNPGLRGRFSRVLDFPAYSVEELVEILLYMTNQRGFLLADDVVSEIYSELSIAYHYPGFANARYIRNLLELAIIKQGSRLNVDATDDEVKTLTAADFLDQEFKTNKKY